jgi:osmotically-inducible protein OsmY
MSKRTRFPRKTFAHVAAVSLALTLAGCIGQERSLSSAVDDFNTRTELNARLLGESPSLFADVSTSVIEGRVHLSGSVATNEERLTATRIAWDTPNVREVVNDIEIKNDADLGDAVRDRWISAQVRTRILTDGGIRDVNYTIDTQNRTVYVLGIAQDQAELDRVIANARAVDGVRRVVNYAVLKDDPRRSAAPRATYVDSDDGVAPPETETAPESAPESE